VRRAPRERDAVLASELDIDEGDLGLEGRGKPAGLVAGRRAAGDLQPLGVEQSGRRREELQENEPLTVTKGAADGAFPESAANGRIPGRVRAPRRLILVPPEPQSRWGRPPWDSWRWREKRQTSSFR
jgi:hypothetical protein